MEENQTKTFDANIDRDTIAIIEFPETIRTRYLRILPTEWEIWVALRFEVIGCQTEISLLADQTSQISTSSSGLSYKAVDGNTDGDYRNGFCTSTDYETNAWWKVDMIGSHCVGRVVIYNRVDCCATPTSEATSTTDNASTISYISTSQSDDGIDQPRTDIVTANPTSKATSTTDKVTSSPYQSTSESDGRIHQTQTDLSTGPIVGAEVGSSIAVLLIILSVFFVLKIRRNRENQPKPDTSSSKPPEVDQPYSLAVLESKPNQQSDSGVTEPVYADPNQDDSTRSTLCHDDIPKASTGNDPAAINYSSVGSTSGPKTTNGQTSDIYVKVENVDAPEGSLYYAPSDTPEDEEGCVENAAYDSFEGTGGKENGADNTEGWEDNTLYGAASRQDEDASGWKDNDIYSGVDD